MAVSAGIAAVASVAGGVIASSGAQSAADTQASAANRATDAQRAMFETVRSDMRPYMDAGQLGLNRLNSTNTFDDFLARYPGFQPVTPQNVLQTPGYQFTLDQGLRAVDNTMSAQGLSGSGAQVKGAADYATGLAQGTYDRQVQNNINNFTTGFNAQMGGDTARYNRLMGVIGVGQGAAAQQGGFGMTAGQQIGNNLISAGNAGAAGAMGSANALAGGFNAAGSGLSQAYMMNTLMNRFGAGGGGPITSVTGASGMG